MVLCGIYLLLRPSHSHLSIMPCKRVQFPLFLTDFIPEKSWRPVLPVAFAESTPRLVAASQPCLGGETKDVPPTGTDRFGYRQHCLSKKESRGKAEWQNEPKSCQCGCATLFLFDDFRWAKHMPYLLDSQHLTANRSIASIAAWAPHVTHPQTEGQSQGRLGWSARDDHAVDHPGIPNAPRLALLALKARKAKECRFGKPTVVGDWWSMKGSGILHELENLWKQIVVKFEVLAEMKENKEQSEAASHAPLTFSL